jgi:ATP-dependent helicase HrpB
VPDLPIQSILPDIRAALATARRAVVQAPPGAGKTTLVPLALLDALWLRGQSIVMLEPRRLATRAAADRLAQLHGSALGTTIGYRMRGDSRVGPATRIEVVTEGVLTRRLQRDPTLDGVGAVLFDEFHERSLDADLGLALALRTAALVRDDLRLLIMSATVDGDAAAAVLGGAPVITSEGRAFPIDTRYLPPRAGTRLEQRVVPAIVDAIRRESGDILVFLPGAGEIRRVEALLDGRAVDGALVAPLYGALPHDAQDRAIRPDPRGRRRIVLATSIAETSLTIEGVRIVIDSGLARQPRFSPASGMTRLETVRVSRASADQRRGRAGRLGPGVCYRLWPEYEDAQLLAHAPPEIRQADLAPLALDLAAAGVDDPRELRWIDPPSPAGFAQARELLRELGALDETRALTDLGRGMAALPMHPRLAAMVLAARGTPNAALACDVAALFSERDVLRSTGTPPDADLALRVQLLHDRRADARSGSLLASAEIDRDAVRRARAESARIARQLRITADECASPDTSALGSLLARAYPDRVAQRRDGSRARFVLRNGRGAELPAGQSLFDASYIVAANLDDVGADGRIFLASALRLDELRAEFSGQIVTEDLMEFDETTGAVEARRRERLGEIILRDVRLADPPPELATAALLAAVRRAGVAAIPWSDAVRRMRARIAFVARSESGWPDVSDEALAATLDDWLAPRLTGARRMSDLARVDLTEALLSLLDWRQRARLDELAPTHLVVPTGSRIPVDYSDPDTPTLSVRLQEVFGLTESPRVANGRVPVTMRLLSPAHRPVQVTRDLAGFWRTSYFEVRKALRGRYPKHEWPEDPLAATPTRRAKPRKG